MRVGEPFVEDVIALADAIDETETQRFLRADVASAQHQRQRGLRADQTRRALRAARAGQKAELHFRQTELRAFDGEPVMRGQRDFQPAAERRAVNRGDDRLAARFDAVADVGQRRRNRRLAELADIRARDETAARAHDQHRARGRFASAASMASMRPRRTAALIALTGA